MRTQAICDTRNYQELKNEVYALRSFVIRLASRDSESEYKSDFVEKILNISNEKKFKKFSNKENFLNDRLRSSKRYL